MDLHIHILLFVLLSPLLSEGFSLHSRKKKDRTADFSETVPEELIENDIAFEEFEQEIEVKEIAIGYLEGAAYICITVFNFITAVATQFEFYRKKLEEEEAAEHGGEEGEAEHGEGGHHIEGEEEGAEHGEGSHHTEGEEEETDHHAEEGRHESPYSEQHLDEESKQHGYEFIQNEETNNNTDESEINKDSSESNEINKLNKLKEEKTRRQEDKSKGEDNAIFNETLVIQHEQFEDNEIKTDDSRDKLSSKRRGRTLKGLSWIASKIFKHM